MNDISDVLIREAAVVDIDAMQPLFKFLDEWHAEICPENFQSFDGDARSREHLTEKLNDPDKVIFVAESDNCLIGLIDVYKLSRPPYRMFRPGEFVMLDNFFIVPEFRGKGVSDSLLNRAKDWGREQGLTEMQLRVVASNDRAIRYYEKTGFEPVTVQYQVKL